MSEEFDIEYHPKEEKVVEKEKKGEKKTIGLGNSNLTTEEMKQKKKEYEEKEGQELFPVIVNGMTKGKNRFYLIKPISVGDMENYDEMVSILQEEEVKSAKALAKKKWLIKEGISVREDDKYSLNEKQITSMQEFIDSFIRNSGNTIMKKITDKAACIIGVVFPEEFSRKMQQVGYGDISLVASAIQVASGWSELALDIDAYEEMENNAEEDNDEYKDLYDEE